MKNSGFLEYICQTFNSVSYKNSKASDAVTTSYWNQWDDQRSASNFKWTDWSAHPAVKNLIHKNTFGSETSNIIHYLKTNYPEFSNKTALSICSGDGDFEKRLIENQVFNEITGLDISDQRVSRANNQSPDIEKLNFIVGNVNDGNFGEDKYDIVFAKAALHHVENLEDLFAGIKKCLKPNGYLVTMDFFGANRFQWSELQIKLASKYFNELIPEELRRLKDDSVKTSVYTPGEAEMIALDPSEAIRSSEVFGFIEKHFSTLDVKDIGGSLLHLIFTPDILENFDENNPAHTKIIEQIYTREKQHIETGDIQSDFKFIIAS